ncbi:hypothetical protein PP568_19730 [Mycobacteroides abscessus]|uniref:Uncharacterized protein n=1 Tax=Mycobacteroides abscessus subsp. abscessus TaxID=1185650 RepID=A0AB38D5X1_9MYCO|nr:hypothetical protein [Mycobacteroides abscessus]AKP56659.1 hypothetical protein MAUC22_02380 [Mycobacteroides abscessus UC22]MBE5421499.1 hypothetical protein [Mycobacteroides abscessus]MBE5453780.1 hypothetical protein [Mycobacteroides abscessus]MBN7298067.1 hypothetical protein [Mycobacteroides abscessus subsp. abscessus]MBN7327774.1 hypothetical protein [Mycobacteroides abscessus subsp. abscessus]
MRLQRITLIIVGAIQIATGMEYLTRPAMVAAMLGVAVQVPPWVNFSLIVAGARFIGYGIGMLAAARSPRRHRLWIYTMLGIQLTDFIAAAAYLAVGSLPRDHLGPAIALPLLWVLLLGWIAVYIRKTPPNGDEGTPMPTSTSVKTT